jgi:photosystem II stability/assembly factor-like uncharacterized protein/pimeloyl-ACP methyl ester carboxylesterase
MNRRHLASITCSLAALIATPLVAAQEPLPRRAAFGVGIAPAPSGAVELNAVRPGSPADKAGLKVGDRLTTVAGTAVDGQAALTELLRKVAGGSAVEVKFVRDGKEQSATLTTDAQPLETVPDSTVTYSSVRVPEGYRLRTIITEPQKAAGKSPAFLFVQGIYCASLDRPAAPDAVDTRLVHAMAKAGYVTLRVDKPGLGDSEGPPCGDIDFRTELAGYQAALEQLKTLPSVDPDRVYVFGHSMGGVMAPYLAGQTPIRGAIVYGTLARTWLEYSLENVRRQGKLMGADEVQLNAMVQAQSRMLAPVLIEKKTLGDVWAAHPELKQPDDPMLEPTRMYSRHMTFYHQLQDLNLADAWAKAGTSVLAIHGEYDWVTTKLDHDMIAELAGSGADRKSRSVSLPKSDHAFTVHPTLQASIAAMGGGEWTGELPKLVLSWIDEVEGRPTAAAQPASSAPTLAAGEKPAAAQPSAPASSATAWTLLPTERYPGKQDDIFFVNPQTGWYANGAGKIFKTTDGGTTWAQQLHKPGTYWRCLTFLDESTGFAGNIGPGYFPNVSDTNPLYATTDGGATWNPVSAIDGPPVVGLCALEVVKIPFVNAGNLDHKVRLVGVGRVGGPTAFIYSDDLGKTWQQRKLPDSCAMAFDVHFFDDKHGVIASATSANVEESRALILTTDDGGQSWREAWKSTRPFELTWKISFPTRDVGYVTIQSYNPDPAASARFVAKTADGGKSWSELPLIDDAKVRQFGVAFVDESRGFIGAMPAGFETTDGGKSWKPAAFGNAVNKIRVLKDAGKTWLFAIGVQVHKLEVPAE